jgi:hypothetical protein
VTKPTRNVAASVFQRLKNKAKETNRRLDEWLRYFAMERFLYRLTQSSYADQFVLKGAMLFKVWQVATPRPTMDIDLLGEPEAIDRIDTIVQDVCALSVNPNDGLVFHTDSINSVPIAEKIAFDSVRVTFGATLVNARIPMQLDIGYGTVYPSPVRASLPTILDFPSPTLQAYTRESSISEKLHAMVTLDILNSRMKDFFDIWTLSRHFEFDGATLAKAISDTFTHRTTPVPAEPLALTEQFSKDSSKVTQWAAFLKKQQLGEFAPAKLDETISGIADFLCPVLKELSEDSSFIGKWSVGGPWD